MDEGNDYIVGNRLVTFFVVVLSLLSCLVIYTLIYEDYESRVSEYTVLAITTFLWMFRLRRSWFWWMPRLSALAIYVGVSYFVYTHWLDSFSYDPALPCRNANDFLPLLIHITVGTLALNFSLFTDDFHEHGFYIKKGFSALSVIFYALFVPGVFLGAWTLLNSFNLDAAIELVWSLLKTGSYFGVFVALIILLFFLASIPQKRREKRAHTDFINTKDKELGTILAMYQEFVDKGPSCLIYLAEKNSPQLKQNSVLLSKIGGKPYAQEGDLWPASSTHEHESIFCMQLVLEDCKLPKIWQGRLIVVFIVDYEIVVRTYRKPDLENAVDISDKRMLFNEVLLSSKRVPAQPSNTRDVDNEDYYFDEGYTSAYALKSNRSLRERLEGHTQSPELFLDLVLSNAGYPVDESMDIIRQAERPNLIQNEHDAVCGVCGKPLRFLFEFGEILGDDFMFGDAGMVYVYGCDDHPEHAQGFVDSH